MQKSLEARVAELEDVVERLEKKVWELQRRLDDTRYGHYDKIRDLDYRIDKLESRIDSLERR